MKFRSKQIIEAVQWTGDQDRGVDPPWLIEEIMAGRASFTGGADKITLEVATPQGRMFATPGDYVVQLPTGIHVMHAPEFEALYEEVLHGPAE